METELEVGDFVLRTQGFHRRIGRKYKVLSITLTDVYLQDVVTGRCANYWKRTVSTDFVKVGE